MECLGCDPEAGRDLGQRVTGANESGPEGALPDVEPGNQGAQHVGCDLESSGLCQVLNAIEQFRRGKGSVCEK